MKIYTNTIDMARPAECRFWTAPHSDYAFGVKVLRDGLSTDSSISVFEGDVMLSAEAEPVGGYGIYRMSSGDTGSYRFTVRVDGAEETYGIVNVVTDSTVFDKNGETGGVSIDYEAGDGIGIDDHVISLTATIPTDNSQIGNGRGFATVSQVEGMIPVHDTHDLSVEYEDGTTETFTVWTSVD